MIKKLSTPPVIILLDLLFMLLFILLISKKDKIEVKIPNDMLFKNAILVYEDNDGIKYLINKNTKEKEAIYNPPSNVGFQYYKDCKEQCSDYPIYYRNHLYIYFPDDLFNTISKITFIGAHTDYNCKKIDFHVSIDGKIDIKELVKNNPCLEQIEGLDKLIKQKNL